MESEGKHGKEIGKQDREGKAALKGALLNWGQLEPDPTGEITGTSIEYRLQLSHLRDEMAGIFSIHQLSPVIVMNCSGLVARPWHPWPIM